MLELTLNGTKELSAEEHEKIFNDIYNQCNNQYHYLAFDRQIHGFSPLGTYALNYVELRQHENEIIDKLIAKQEVCCLHPIANLTLYPILNYTRGGNDYEYDVDIENAKKHFADILTINDNVLKTPYLYVQFGHGPNNLDTKLVYKYLGDMLKKSHCLKRIFIEL